MKIKAQVVFFFYNLDKCESFVLFDRPNVRDKPQTLHDVVQKNVVWKSQKSGVAVGIWIRKPLTGRNYFFSHCLLRCWKEKAYQMFFSMYSGHKTPHLILASGTRQFPFKNTEVKNGIIFMKARTRLTIRVMLGPSIRMAANKVFQELSYKLLRAKRFSFCGVSFTCRLVFVEVLLEWRALIQHLHYCNCVRKCVVVFVVVVVTIAILLLYIYILLFYWKII